MKQTINSRALHRNLKLALGRPSRIIKDDILKAKETGLEGEDRTYNLKIKMGLENITFSRYLVP